MKNYYFVTTSKLLKHLSRGVLALMLVSFSLSSANAQDKTISGRVVDENSEGLPGVNVIIKGTTDGTVTDIDGNYRLSAPDGAVLVFSAIGYANQEITPGARTTVDITMAIDVEELEEVVVVGYTTQSKQNLTGAVGQVDVSEAVKVPIVNAAEALQGRATGVSVVTQGQPGSAPIVRVRGYGTPNGNDPLYIIDGVQTDDANVLNTINPSDIAQMNVLKDGAAAIYGARASNGVVIITTKNGKYNSGAPKVSFEAYFGSQSAANLPELLNAQQHGDMVWESKNNDGTTLDHPQYGTGSSAVVPGSLQGTSVPTTVASGGTDWLDELFQSAGTQNYALTIQNGTEASKMLMSLNYLNRDGIQVGTGYERVTTRMNTEFSIQDRVRIGEHLNVSFENSLGGNSTQGALRMNPLIPVYDDNGAFAGTYAAAAQLGNQTNPVADRMRASDDFNRTLRAFGDVYLEADLFEGLTFKTSLGVNYRNFNGRYFTPLNPEHSEARSTNTLQEQAQTGYEWVWSNTMNYDNTFGDHSINVLVGTEAVYNYFKGNGVSRTNYLFEDPNFYLLSNGAGDPIVNWASTSDYSLFSVFGSVNYAFQGKYLLSATLRNDQTSRFAKTNAAATFPAFSAGWVISEESFFPQSSGFSTLKLKASWGLMGNQSLPVANPDVNQSQLNDQLSFYSFDGNGGATAGALLSQVGNAELQWETSESLNIGAELGFLDDKMSVSFDWYSITTNDLISRDNSKISTTAIDAGAPFVNIGEFNNSGIDLAIGYGDQTSSGFSYGVDVVFSQYTNEVVDLINEFYTGNGGYRGGAVTRTERGRVLSEFYGRNVIGIFSSASEVSAAADQGFENPEDGVGRFQYEDVNGDGVINDDDRTYIGSPHPSFTYGINLNLGYKGIDLSAFFQGSAGNDIYNYAKIYTDFPTFFNGNRSTRVLDSWSETNTGAELPALSESITNNETAPNSYFVEDGSFFRLKNLQIGYTIPANISSKLAMSSARIYVQGTNLFTITNYTGLDPEVTPRFNGDGSVDNLTLGVDSGLYPQARIMTVGFNFNF